MNFVKPLLVASIVAFVSATNTTNATRTKPILTAEQLATIRQAAVTSVNTCLSSGKKAKECAKKFKEELKAAKADGERINRGQAYAEFKQAVAEVMYGKFQTCMQNNNNDRIVCYKKALELGLDKKDIKKLLIKGADGKAADEFRACKKSAADDAAKTACRDAAKAKLKAAFPANKITDEEAEREMKKNLAKEAVEVFKKCMEDSSTEEQKKECKDARKAAKPDWIGDKEAKFYYRRAAWVLALDTYIGCMEDELLAGTPATCAEAAKEDYLAAGGKPYADFVTKIQTKYANKDKVKVLRKLNKIALSLEIDGVSKDKIIAKLADLRAKINTDTGAAFGSASQTETASGSVEVDFEDSTCTDCAADLSSVPSKAETSAAALLDTKRRRLLETTTVSASAEQSLEEVVVEDGDWVADDSAAAGLRAPAAFIAATAFALQFLV